ncbi:hypothetical protein [Bordetella avium]|nr:hypothetical protein [Bordetella avium]AZY49661.1 hypothetical protein C0J09_11315 [Bordetella avium]RIQ49538.1 hypothetical protein D0843_13625 [Bordetella avium]
MDKTLDTIKTEAEIAKLMAETGKLNAEAAKMIRERAWYPIVIVAAAFTTGAALAKLVIG